ncbi:MAG: Mbeg1-like protein [Bifidobacterium scardovii]|uniref:Mbeg1-like protein n=1 Tax=Bifidobacterium scardovii TaxID=158787 RepID=UPI002904E628|nr:Mbeg1-like protein [Bifidobacterium scardovii]MDU2422157.1 Mbeg1-like protein [Bifidobacterium scardovii]
MGNITDDIRADLEDFDTRPFGETDSLALSQLAYARMPDNVPRHREPTDDAGDGGRAPGPGFDEAFFASPGYARIAPKISKSVPESSIIGMLFETREHVEDGYTVVRSDGASIMQHFALNWQVDHGRFAHADGLSASARYLARTINDWMAKYDDEHRRRFIENLFAIFEAGGYATFGELSSHWTQSLPLMIAAARGIDAEDRDVILAVVKGLAATAATSVIPAHQ